MPVKKSATDTLSIKGITTGPAILGTPALQSFRPLPEDHIFYGMVGRVASEWAHLEHALDLIIWELAGGQQSALACITAQIMGVGPRCKAILALGTLRKLPSPLLKRVRTLMSDSYHVSDLRARWVHDAWYLEEGSGHAAQFKSMPYSDQRHGFFQIDKDQLGDTLSKIQNLRNVAMDLKRDVLTTLASSRKDQP
jgi:hypothetical protein